MLYPHYKEPPIPINGKLRGPESRFRHFRDEKVSGACLDSVPVRALFVIQTELSWKCTGYIRITSTGIFGKHPYLTIRIHESYFAVQISIRRLYSCSCHLLHAKPTIITWTTPPPLLFKQFKIKPSYNSRHCTLYKRKGISLNLKYIFHK